MMNAVQIILIVTSLLSSIGSGYIVYRYYELRLQGNFSLRMITYLSVGDLIYSLSNLLYTDNGQYIAYANLSTSKKWQCQIQAFMMQFSEMVCFLFCLFLCYCIYLSVIKNRNNIQSNNLYYQIVGWCIPLLLAIVVTSTQVCGPQAFICGFADNNPNSGDNNDLVAIEAGLFFFLPLWLCSIANFYFIVRVLCFFKALKSRMQSKKDDSQLLIFESPQDIELQISKEITVNMLWYPGIMLLCWLPATVYGISKLAGSPILWLRGARIICADCLGLFNAIAYKINTDRIKKLRQDIANAPEIQMKSQSEERQLIGSFLDTSNTDFLNY